MYQNQDNHEGEIDVVSERDRSDALQRMDDHTFTSVLVHQAGMRKSIIYNLVKRSLLFTEVSYGGGIYRIILETA